MARRPLPHRPDRGRPPSLPAPGGERRRRVPRPARAHQGRRAPARRRGAPVPPRARTPPRRRAVGSRRPRTSRCSAPAELGMLVGEPGPTLEVVARRRRLNQDAIQAPALPQVWTGTPPAVSVDAAIGERFEGWSASPGRYEGLARVVRSPGLHGVPARRGARGDDHRRVVDAAVHGRRCDRRRAGRSALARRDRGPGARACPRS